MKRLLLFAPLIAIAGLLVVVAIPTFTFAGNDPAAGASHALNADSSLLMNAVPPMTESDSIFTCVGPACDPCATATATPPNWHGGPPTHPQCATATPESCGIFGCERSRACPSCVTATPTTTATPESCGIFGCGRPQQNPPCATATRTATPPPCVTATATRTATPPPCVTVTATRTATPQWGGAATPLPCVTAPAPPAASPTPQPSPIF